MILNSFVWVILGTVCLDVVTSVTSANDTLLLVHVLHRHGDRTPNKIPYKNNPISNESFYAPFGFGQVSTNGMKIAYKIGLTLRQKYNKFLGDQLNPKYIEARTTNVNRTKVSLALVLAGLWPPSREDKFWPCLNWQPIPYNYYLDDKELNGRDCLGYKQAYDIVFNSPEIQNIISSYNELFDYVSNATGEEFRTLDDLFDLNMDTVAQQAFGYPIEDWLKPIFPDALEKIIIDQYYIDINTTELQQYAVGFFLKKIINDSKNKINDTLVPRQRKMFIYSAHETNLAFVLITLGVFDFKVPPYACFILFEVHLIDGVYGFKIYYHDWTTTEPKLMVIPGCQEFCPYDTFVEIFRTIIPDDNIC